MPKTKGKSCGPRSRSFGGCITCRRRKIKCDEGQPSCAPCKRSRIECGGYGATVRFVFYGDNGELLRKGVPVSDENRHGRRVLFEDDERARMSRQLRSLIDEDRIDEVMSELDSKEMHIPETLFQRGPFGVFLGITEQLPACHDEFILEAGCTFSTDSNSQVHEKRNQEFSVPAMSETEAAYTSTATHESSLQLASPIRLQIQLSSDTNHPLSQHTSFLLEYYKSQLGTLFSPLRVRQPPWSFLHFPCALSTLSELSICKTATHSKTSLLFSILAVSAFNLDRIVSGQMNSTNYWWVVGDKLRQQAQTELCRTAEMEMGSRRGKYLHVLMAMLKMVTISVVSGQQEDARSMLLEAESFIVQRGAGKANKSRKVRVLHYIYLYLRVIEESTHIYTSGDTQSAPPSLETGNMLYPSLRTHCLRLGKDMDALCGGNFEVVLFGDCSNIQKDEFAEIYGFPQQLVSFISRTTYLSNAITATATPFARFTSLDQQSRHLETEICEWTPNEQTATNTDDPFSLLANQIMMPHLISAIHSATIIFFYRRIRNVHPLMLQHYAENTISSLEKFEAEKKSLCLTNCGIVWPGFMAASEALDEGLRERSRVLLRGCARATGMRNFDVACDVVESVWGLKRDMGSGVDWGCVVRPALVLT